MGLNNKKLGVAEQKWRRRQAENEQIKLDVPIYDHSIHAEIFAEVFDMLFSTPNKENKNEPRRI